MSKPIDQELLPCPFCGDPSPNLTHDDYVHEDGRPMAVVECAKCHTWVRAEAWNKRASVQPAGVAVPDKMSGAVGFAKGIQDGWNAAVDAVLKLNAAPHPVSGEQKWSSFEEWLEWEIDQGDGTSAPVSKQQLALAKRLWSCIASSSAQQGEQPS